MVAKNKKKLLIFAFLTSTKKKSNWSRFTTRLIFLDTRKS